MAFRLRKPSVTTTERDRPSGGWYADPFGTASRRWYDDLQGWTDQVQGEGNKPDKTGVARVDEARGSTREPSEHPDAEGEPAPS